LPAGVEQDARREKTASAGTPLAAEPAVELGRQV
jgi:hypothetical protein